MAKATQYKLRLEWCWNKGTSSQYVSADIIQICFQLCIIWKMVLPVKAPICWCAVSAAHPVWSRVCRSGRAAAASRPAVGPAGLYWDHSSQPAAATVPACWTGPSCCGTHNFHQHMKIHHCTQDILVTVDDSAVNTNFRAVLKLKLAEYLHQWDKVTMLCTASVTLD